MYLVSSDAISWAVDAKNGRVRWQIDGLADVNNATGTTGPSVSQKYVVFGFGSGEVQAISQRQSRTLDLNFGWRSCRAGVVNDRRHWVNTSLAWQCLRGKLHRRIVALNLDSGERLWSAPFGTKSLIWPAGGSVFFLSDCRS